VRETESVIVGDARPMISGTTFTGTLWEPRTPSIGRDSREQAEVDMPQVGR
jgi:hypothetical protein